VSTTKKYLEILHKHNFVEKRNLEENPGKPTQYTLIKKKFVIEFDLDSTIDKGNLDTSNIWNPLIREKSNLEPLIRYKFNTEDQIEEIKIKIKTKARRYITKTLKLGVTERMFMKYLPYPTMDPNNIIKICFKANIASAFEIKSIENFVKKLKKYGIIDIIK
jgi:hypothetical protein